MKNIKINKRILVSVLTIVLLVSVGWFAYHSYHKKQVALVQSYLEAGKEDFDKEDFDKSIVDYSKVIELSSKEPTGYVLRAYSYFLKGEYDKALADTDKVLTFSKDNPSEFYSLRGDSFRYSQRFKEATNEYAKAYNLSPTDKDTVNNYVGGLIAIEQYTKGYEVIKKYFNEIPKDEYWEDIDAWYNRAFTAYGTHRCLEASTSAWHVLMRTKEDDYMNKVAGGIMSKAMKDKECVDQNTFVKDEK